MSYLFEMDQMPTVLGAQAAGWSTSSLSEVLLTSVQIPANAMGTNGALEVFSHWTWTNNANSKTLRVRWGSSNDLTGNQMIVVSPTANSSVQEWNWIQNMGATNSQKDFVNSTSARFSTNSNNMSVASIDTTAATWIVFSALVANGGDTLKLEQYSVILYPGV